MQSRSGGVEKVVNNRDSLSSMLKAFLNADFFTGLFSVTTLL